MDNTAAKIVPASTPPELIDACADVMCPCADGVACP